MQWGAVVFSMDLGSGKSDGHVVVALRGELDLMDAAAVAVALGAVAADEFQAPEVREPPSSSAGASSAARSCQLAMFIAASSPQQMGRQRLSDTEREYGASGGGSKARGRQWNVIEDPDALEAL